MTRGNTEESLKLPNPWAAVGRDTTAGRALFALYNGFGQARIRGNNYSQHNKLKIQKHIATHGPPEFPVTKPLLVEKPNVKVPHFYTKRNHYDDIFPIEIMRGRRKASHMLEQMREDSYIVELPPLPKGPLLDDTEKARLQEVFYWSNRNIGPNLPEEEQYHLRPQPKKDSIEEQEMLLNTIAKEIEHREAFLAEMESYGKADKYRMQILGEVQKRVSQMQMLHERITFADHKALFEMEAKEASENYNLEYHNDEFKYSETNSSQANRNKYEHSIRPSISNQKSSQKNLLSFEDNHLGTSIKSRRSKQNVTASKISGITSPNFMLEGSTMICTPTSSHPSKECTSSPTSRVPTIPCLIENAKNVPTFNNPMASTSCPSPLASQIDASTLRSPKFYSQNSVQTTSPLNFHNGSLRCGNKASTNANIQTSGGKSTTSASNISSPGRR